MKIESIIRRKSGTQVQLDEINYHFKPVVPTKFPKTTPHLCEVTDRAHIQRFLSITEGFRISDDEDVDVTDLVELVDPTAGKSVGPGTDPDETPDPDDDALAEQEKAEVEADELEAKKDAEEQAALNTEAPDAAADGSAAEEAQDKEVSAKPAPVEKPVAETKPSVAASAKPQSTARTGRKTATPKKKP